MTDLDPTPETPPKIEFTVDVEPRKIGGSQDNADQPDPVRTVYDIKVRDLNGNLLMFSNQGYENRAFARDLAIRLFSGKPARLFVWSADRATLVELHWLGNGAL